jgi:HAD superfamily hydrolase (TIGR01509 family)
MLKAILFDLDGTLANTDPIHFGIWQRVLRPHGITFDKPFYNAHFSGRLNPDIVSDLLPELTPQAGQSLSAYKEACFREAAADQLQPLPGLLPLLDWLKQRQLLSAVVTNAPRPNAEFMLKTLELMDTFDLIIISDDLPRGKPDPLPYQEALRRFSLTPEEAVVFEDSPSGIRSAVAAGITTIGVASTHGADELERLGVKFAIADFTDKRLHHVGIMV